MMTKMYIGGEWVDGETSSENVNPSDLSDIIGAYASGGAVDVDRAVDAAADAAQGWAFSSPEARSDLLDRIGAELLNRKEEIGDLLAREEGKTLPEGVGEVARAGRIFKFFAGEALRVGGERLDSVRPNVKVEISREPVGVVGAITPWNFPIAIPAWKTAPALAFGNAVVLKPADLTPGCACALAEVIDRAGAPAGVFNLVLGKGSKVGQALVDNSKVNALSFTGSVGVGSAIREAAGRRGARVQLEMGGKNPLIVVDDADINTAVNCVLQGAFYSTGQRCTATSRIIVTDGIADKFVEAFVAATKQLKIGDARESGIQIGPLASAEQFEKVSSYVEIGKSEGAALLAGGEPVKAAKRGYYFAPVVFDRTTDDMRVNKEEIFGPVATIIRVRNYDEALTTANGTPFGLSAGIVTRSLKLAEHFKRGAQAGMVMVNLPTAGVDYHVPFGGTKCSSHGPREQGAYAKEFYTIVKTAYQLPL